MTREAMWLRCAGGCGTEAMILTGFPWKCPRCKSDPRRHSFAGAGENERQCSACGRREIWCGEDFGGWRDSTRVGDPKRAPCASWDLDAR